jgi:riboflavin synthase
VEKGSIALNGVSLTLNTLGEPLADGTFLAGLTIIPHTWRHTSLQSMAVGEAVNVEVDVLAKYVEQLCHGYLTPSAV